MNSWQKMHGHYINGNDNAAKEFVKNINDEIPSESQYAELFKQVDNTIDIIRIKQSCRESDIKQSYEEKFTQHERSIEFNTAKVANLTRQVQQLSDELIRINNIPTPPPPRNHDTCSEILDVIEEVKQTMTDQSYRTITEKLMEIYHR